MTTEQDTLLEVESVPKDGTESQIKLEDVTENYVKEVSSNIYVD